MGTLIGIAAIVGLVLLIRWMVKGMNPPSQTDIAKASAKKISAKKKAKKSERPVRRKNFTLPPIPDGHQIYLERAYVSGVQHYSDQVWDLAAQEKPVLSWEANPENPHDENAIQIYAGSGADKQLIGYVSKELAAVLADYDRKDELAIRFSGAKAHENWLEVFYQITGPKKGKQEFRTFYDKNIRLS